MSQKAKQWLRAKPSTFTIKPVEGGYVGSLIGLGFLKKETRQTETGPVLTGAYKITDEGRDWIDRPKG